jgi:hypothetical protein
MPGYHCQLVYLKLQKVYQKKLQRVHQKKKGLSLNLEAGVNGSIPLE